jgi:hypothetical protein
MMMMRVNDDFHSTRVKAVEKCDVAMSPRRYPRRNSPIRNIF